MCSRTRSYIIGELLRRTFPYIRGVCSMNYHIPNSCLAVLPISNSRLQMRHLSNVLEDRPRFIAPVQKASFSADANERQIKLRSDPNKFGDLNEGSPVEKIHNEDDVIEENYITYPVPRQQQLRIKQYADIIKEHLQKKDVLAAVNVLETRMIKEDRVKPDSYIFSLIISACGRFGHTKKAFQLYNKMKQRQLKIPGAVYTALFNACANDDSPKNGIERALKLQSQLTEKGIELNATHYHAMMKAFGRCGDLSRAFQVVDAMIDKQVEVDERTFNFLLQACISNKEDGFRFALLVWQKMQQRHVKPTLYSFNLLLRCVRDCNMGELQEVKTVIQQILGGGGQEIPTICEDTNSVTMRLSGEMSLEVNPVPGEMPSSQEFIPDLLSSKPMSLEVNPVPGKMPSSQEFIPDLLSSKPYLRCDIASLDLTKPHERLFLLGGSSKFLLNMEKCNVPPDIKTFTLLLDCIAPTLSAEKQLISNLRRSGLSIDIEFCNMLIKKRSFRFDYQNAKDVLRLIKTEKLQPDIITFGVLALSCTTEDEANELLHNMRLAGYRINQEILGAMLKQGCLKHNFKYVTKILYLVQKENIEPSPKFMEDLKCLITSSRQILNNKFHGAVPPSLQKGSFKKEFTTFMYKYEAWLNEIRERK